MPYTSVAYVFLAYEVLACEVLANEVVAYIVMAVWLSMCHGCVTLWQGKMSAWARRGMCRAQLRWP